MSQTTIPNLKDILPILGVSYSPVPSDDTPSPPQKYFDTDFTNSSFPLIWGSENSGRGDIKNLAAIGVNFVHLYDWSVPPAPGNPPGDYQRNHLPFLKECATQAVKVFVPISNYFLEQIHQGQGDTVKGQILAMVTEVYDGKTSPLPGAGMWGIGNEFDLAAGKFDAADVATAIQYLLEAETTLNITAANTLPITSPVSFAVQNDLPPGIQAIQDLQAAIKANGSIPDAFWDGRFVASTNPNNDGDFIKNYIDVSFPKYYPNLPFFFSEMGINTGPGPAPTDADQAAFVGKQLAASQARGNFLGCCVFQFLDQTAMKTGSQATFGMTKYSGTQSTTGTIEPSDYDPRGNGSYPVDVLTHKPLYDTVKSAYLLEEIPLEPGAS